MVRLFSQLFFPTSRINFEPWCIFDIHVSPRPNTDIVTAHRCISSAAKIAFDARNEPLTVNITNNAIYGQHIYTLSHGFFKVIQREIKK